MNSCETMWINHNHVMVQNVKCIKVYGTNLVRVINFFINASHYATDIQMSDAGWYGALTSQLTAEQQQELNDVVVLADQRKAAAGMY